MEKDPSTVVEIGFTIRALAAETNDRRFELFCCELLTLVEGEIVVPTSATRDAGRDGHRIPQVRDRQLASKG